MRQRESEVMFVNHFRRASGSQHINNKHIKEQQSDDHRTENKSLRNFSCKMCKKRKRQGTGTRYGYLAMEF